MPTPALRKDASTMPLRAIRRAALTVAAVSLAVLAGASPASAATPPGFSVTIGSKCAQVAGTPTASVIVRQLASDGSVLESVSAGFGGGGTTQVCFAEDFLVGMRIRATAEGLTRTLTIPKLTIGVDRTTDVIRGAAPAGTKVGVTVDHRVQFTVGKEWSFTRTASSTGHWSLDTTSSFNLIGGDSIHVVWDNGTDSVDRWAMTPQLTARIGSSRIVATLLPGQSGSVVLRNSSGTLRGKAYVAVGYDWEATGLSHFVNTSGLRVAARVGDRVSAPFQPSMAFTIPTLTVSVNSATNVVSGACPANRRLLVGAESGFVTPLIEAKCSAGGTYSVDTTASQDIVTGTKVTVWVKLTSGDQVTRVRIAP